MFTQCDLTYHQTAISGTDPNIELNIDKHIRDNSY